MKRRRCQVTTFFLQSFGLGVYIMHRIGRFSWGFFCLATSFSDPGYLFLLEACMLDLEDHKWHMIPFCILSGTGILTFFLRDNLDC